MVSTTWANTTMNSFNAPLVVTTAVWTAYLAAQIVFYLT